MTATPNVQQAVPFLRVADLARSVRYYVDGLGFEMTKKWIDGGRLRWCWLQRDGAAVMLQEFAKHGHDSWVPQGKVGEGVAVYFICADALAIYRDITARGIAATVPEVENGMWVTRLTDPDGYELAFESLADAAEDAVYTPERS